MMPKRRKHRMRTRRVREARWEREEAWTVAVEQVIDEAMLEDTAPRLS